MISRSLRVVGRRVIASAPFIDLAEYTVENSVGEQRRWTTAQRAATDIAVVWAATTDGELHCIEQFRPPVDRFVLENIAGLVDDGETPAEAAARELQEEAGLEAEELVELPESPECGGISTARLHFYLGVNCRMVGEPKREPTEAFMGLRVVRFPLRGLLRAIRRYTTTNPGVLIDPKVYGGHPWWHAEQRKRRRP